MATITIQLAQGRTAEQVYKDAALVNGYKPTIIKDNETDFLTEEEKNNFVFPDNFVEGSDEVLSFTQEDGSVLYKIRYQTEEPNPVSEIDFGKEVVQRKFGEIDSELVAKATEIRMKEAYGL